MAVRVHCLRRAVSHLSETRYFRSLPVIYFRSRPLFAHGRLSVTHLSPSWAAEKSQRAQRFWLALRHSVRLHHTCHEPILGWQRRTCELSSVRCAGGVSVCADGCAPTLLLLLCSGWLIRPQQLAAARERRSSRSLLQRSKLPRPSLCSSSAILQPHSVCRCTTAGTATRRRAAPAATPRQRAAAATRKKRSNKLLQQRM